MKSKSTKLFENRKAYHNFFIFDSVEAGIELKGSEVKAIREGKIDFTGSYVKLSPQGAEIVGMYIKPYSHAGIEVPDPRRPRRLLLHKRQLLSLFTKVQQKKMTVIPLKIYFNKKNLVKVEIALAKAKKKRDKREVLKKKQDLREIKKAG